MKKIVAITIFSLISLRSFSFTCFNTETQEMEDWIWRFYNQETEEWEGDPPRISNCWDTSKYYKVDEARWYPTCDDSYALSIDPYIHGVGSYLRYFCENDEADLSLINSIEGVSYPSRSINCDPFNAMPRVLASFWLLRKMGEFGEKTGSHHYNNWYHKVSNDIGIANGLTFKCDITDPSDWGVLQAIAVNPGGLFSLNVLDDPLELFHQFYFTKSMDEGVNFLAHEGHHEHSGHINCVEERRGHSNKSCDKGYEVFNPEESVYSTYTIGRWASIDLLSTTHISDDQTDNFLIERISNPIFNQDADNEEEPDVLYWQMLCRMKPLLNRNLSLNTFNNVSIDDFRINIPLPTYEYETLEELEDCIFPKWVCSPDTDCSEYLYDPQGENHLSCNPTLVPENEQVNQENYQMCISRLEEYRNRLRDDENTSQETTMSIHETEANERHRLSRQCIRPNQEHINNYCATRIDSARDAFDVDHQGYMAEFGHSSADLCVQMYCARPEIMYGIYGSYLNTPGFNYAEYFYDLFSESDQVNNIRNRVAPEAYSCIEYFCGEDIDCQLRYIRFEGNIELATSQPGSCVGDYLSCIERTGENFNLDDYPEYIIPREESSEDSRFQFTEEDRERMIASGLGGFTCMEAYSMCNVRESAQKGFILANLFREKAENERLISRALGIEKINPNDLIRHRVRLSGKQHFTNELLFEIEKLKKSPQNLESVKRFNYWFSMPENQSKFAHYMPEDYLAFTNYKRASYIAGPWINSFKPTDTSKLSSVAKLIDEYNRLGKLLSNYKGEDIQQILMDASKNLPKKEYLELFNKFKNAETLTGKINALNEMSKK